MVRTLAVVKNHTQTRGRAHENQNDRQGWPPPRMKMRASENVLQQIEGGEAVRLTSSAALCSVSINAL